MIFLCLSSWWWNWKMKLACSGISVDVSSDDRFFFDEASIFFLMTRLLSANFLLVSLGVYWPENASSLFYTLGVQTGRNAPWFRNIIVRTLTRLFVDNVPYFLFCKKRELLKTSLIVRYVDGPFFEHDLMWSWWRCFVEFRLAFVSRTIGTSWWLFLLEKWLYNHAT